MSQQLQITGGAKVRDLNDVIIGTSGVLSSLAFNVANGVPKLDSNAKILVSQLPNSVMEYQGTWNANTNTPTLTNGGAFNQGDVYLCNVAGTTNFGAGPIAFIVGDSAIYSGSIWQRSGGATGSVTSVGLSTDGNAITIGSSPITTSGTITANFAGTNLQYINGAGNLTTFPTLLSSVGLSMPSAFSVSNSPLTANGTIAVTGAGNASQYIRGDGTLAAYNPSTGGGGSSQTFYFNGSVASSVVGYEQMSTTANTGTSTDFSISADGYIASFLTDVSSPNQLNIPAGNWNFEIYMNSSSSGGSPSFYVELYKYASSTFTLIATSSANPEYITNGTAVDLYTTALAVPATVLTVNDRLAVRVYVTHSSKTITMHTQDSNLSSVITTFSTGITALNGLTAQVQYFATGTSGTDFNISSSTATHTFNIPDASATARGLITTGTQTIAGSKTFSGQLKSDALFLIKEGVGMTAVTGYTSISTTSTSFAFYNGANTSSATFTYMGSAYRSYTLPTSNGTIALTSDLSSYVPTSRQLTINGTAYDLSADRTWSVGTVTSVAALTIGTTGTDLSSTVATGTTTPVITLNVPTASATNRGALSSTDWSTFNSKESALTFSSPLVRTTNTISIPAATTSVNGYLTSTDWNTFNNKGSGTVTSVAMTVPTGLSIAGSPITSSGTLAVTFASGYSIPTNASQTNWDTAYTNRITSATSPLSIAANVISIAQATTSTSGFLSSTDWTTFNGKQATITLTTTGTSGAATFTSNTLNIPNYAPDLSGYVPYTGATGAVNLGNYNLTVYGLTLGRGGGNIATNTALGYQAINAGTATQNDQNTAVGYQSLFSNTQGQYNTSLGYQSLYTNIIGSSNTAIGWYSLYTNTGDANTGTGKRSLYKNTSGSYNSGFGNSALDQITTGSNNSALGYAAGYGTGTNYITTGSNNIFIGYQSVGESSTESNRTWIGNTSTTSTWVGGKLLVGTRTTGIYDVDVTGTARFTSNIYSGGLGINTVSLTSGWQSDTRGNVLISGSTTTDGRLSVYYGNLGGAASQRLDVGSSTVDVYNLNVKTIVGGNFSGTVTASITNAGAASFNSTLTVGTTAYITNDAFIGDTTTGSGRFFITDSSNQGITLRRTGATGDRFKMFVGNGTTYTQDNCIILGTNTDIDFYTGSSPLKRLTIANTGEATFSSSVTAAIGTFNGTGYSVFTNSAYLQTASSTGLSFGYNRSGANGESSIVWGAPASGFNFEIASVTSGTITPRLTITNGGNVGIGASPVTKLDVRGTSASADATIQIVGNSVSTLLLGQNSRGGVIRGQGGSNELSFWTGGSGDTGAGSSGTEQMRIASTGAATFSADVTLASTGTAFMVLNNTTPTTGKVWRFSSASNGYLFISQVGVIDAITIAPTTGATTFSSLGTGTVTATSGTLSTVSDMNLKIEDGFIDNALGKVMNLKPRYFHWKEESGLPTDLRQLGFFAQEVNEALGEEAANTPKTENDKWGIYDRGIIAMLTKAIQEQNQTITSLQEQINELKNK